MKTVLIGLAAALSTAAGVAVAQDMQPPRGGGGGGGAMMRADANGDGVITRQEMIDQATQRFDRLDANGDGRLDASELPQPGRRMRGDMPPPAGDAAPRQ